jgi:hypothetical protein
MLAAHTAGDGTNSVSSVPYGLTADTSTGELLDLDDLVTGGVSTLLPVVQPRVSAQVSCGYRDNGQIAAATCPSTGRSGSWTALEAWTVTPTGLRFWFDKGRLSANPAGITWVDVPWTALGGSLTVLGRDLWATSAAANQSSPAWDSGSGVAQFISPSGNIGCVLTTDVARCDIAARDYPDPPDPASCDRDYGNSLILEAGSAGIGCVGDTILYEGHEFPVLGYGQRVTRGQYTCSMAEDGVRCQSASGHGFTLAREGFTVW